MGVGDGKDLSGDEAVRMDCLSAGTAILLRVAVSKLRLNNDINDESCYFMWLWWWVGTRWVCKRKMLDVDDNDALALRCFAVLCCAALWPWTARAIVAYESNVAKPVRCPAGPALER